MDNGSLPKLLIISYYWPPSAGPGVHRWLHFARHLRNLGWEPIIYTPANPSYPTIDPKLEKWVSQGITILRQPIMEPYAWQEKLFGGKGEQQAALLQAEEQNGSSWKQHFSLWLRANVFIPDARMLWVRPSVRFLSKWLKSHPVDAMASTGPPHSMHLIGLKLKRRFPELTWLADFRDPWTDMTTNKKLPMTSRARKRHATLEKQVLQEADEVIAVGWQMAELYRQHVDREYQIITNGFVPQPEKKDALPDYPKHKFTVVHLGSFMEYRNPPNLWLALQELCAEHQDFAQSLQLRLGGEVEASVWQSIQIHGLEEYVQRLPYLSHIKASQEYHHASVLLLLVENYAHAQNLLPLKTFEYLETDAPVLCIGKREGDYSRILSETEKGQTFDYLDKAGIKNFLLHRFSLWKKGQNQQIGQGTERYQRKAQAQQLVDVLNKYI